MIKESDSNKICSFKYSSNSDGVLELVFWQTLGMREIFSKYPNVICVDATYKLNRSGYPVFIIIIIDANFQTRIAALAFMANDHRSDLLEMLFNWFNEFNPAFTEIKTIISDKNEPQINILRKLYPQTDISLCLYHVFKSLKLESYKKTSHSRLNDIRSKNILFFLILDIYEFIFIF